MNIKEYDKALQGAKEIAIPYSLICSRYPSFVANIMEKLHESTAEIAKKKSPEDFKWHFAYKQPDDPKTFSQESFVEELCNKTDVYLIARGFNWRGGIKLEGKVPTQILTRYQDRAKIICSDVKAKGVENVENNLNKDISFILQCIGNLASSGSLENPAYLEIAKTAIVAFQQSNTESKV